MRKLKPVFLERKGYRRRRLMDAVRMLPFLGLVLWMVPLMWSVPDAGEGPETTSISDALTYIFGIWGLLVLGAFLLWGRTRAAPGTAAEDGPA